MMFEYDSTVAAQGQVETSADLQQDHQHPTSQVDVDDTPYLADLMMLDYDCAAAAQDKVQESSPSADEHQEKQQPTSPVDLNLTHQIFVTSAVKYSQEWFKEGIAAFNGNLLNFCKAMNIIPLYTNVEPPQQAQSSVQGVNPVMGGLTAQKMLQETLGASASNHNQQIVSFGDSRSTSSPIFGNPLVPAIQCERPNKEFTEIIAQIILGSSQRHLLQLEVRKLFKCSMFGLYTDYYL